MMSQRWRVIDQLCLIFLLSTFFLAIADEPLPAQAVDNGLARTPPMGWNPFNSLGSSYDSYLREAADELARDPDGSGPEVPMRDLGYKYVNFDGGWMKANRNSVTHDLEPSDTWFPYGMASLSSYIRSKGLKFGGYLNVGCHPGETNSIGYEQQDINLLGSWNVEYVKADTCDTTGSVGNYTSQQVYERLKAAIDNYNNANPTKKMLLSIASGGDGSPWEWGPTTGNMWRTTDDLRPCWADCTPPYGESVLQVLDKNSTHAAFAGPGGWNDPDMLVVGVSSSDPNQLGKNYSTLSDAENRAHFTMWAMMAAPLILGNDIAATDQSKTPGGVARNPMSATTRAILTNKEVIAIDQDPLGHQAIRVQASGSLEVWYKVLSTNGQRAVALLNRSSAAANITVNWSAVGLSGNATVRDLWAKQDKGTFNGSYTQNVPSHGVVLVKISGTPLPTTTYQTENLSFSTSGGSHRIYDDTGCSNQKCTILEKNGDGSSVTYTVNVPLAGVPYRVRVGVKTFNSRGRFRLTINTTDHGRIFDLYENTPNGTYKEYTIATVQFGTTGNKSFTFTVKGQNDNSTGYTLSFDYIKLVP